MKLKAYAKINLALDVIGTYPNGYHQLDMIMQPIDLYDNIALEVNDEYKDNVFFDEQKILGDNTVTKALNVLREKYQFVEHFDIEINKKIPMEAGLAGGSADAAAVIHGVNELLALNLTLSEMIEIGVKVGADVPFCLVNELARVEGIGEKVTPLNKSFEKDVLLIKPVGGVNTKQAFSKMAEYPIVHPNIKQIIESMDNNEIDYTLLQNSLSNVAEALNPEIEEIFDFLKPYKLNKVLMSGSGSTIMVFGDLVILKKIMQDISSHNWYINLTKTCNKKSPRG